jgi:hypothetical protein
MGSLVGRAAAASSHPPFSSTPGFHHETTLHENTAHEGLDKALDQYEESFGGQERNSQGHEEVLTWA